MPSEKQRGNSGNLKPWKKGQSGNPAGRPKKEDCITSLLEEQLAELKPRDPHKRTWAQCVVAALLQAATAGDIRAAGLILERTEGKVRQDIGVDVDVMSEIDSKIAEGRQRAAQRNLAISKTDTDLHFEDTGSTFQGKPKVTEGASAAILADSFRNSSEQRSRETQSDDTHRSSV